MNCAPVDARFSEKTDTGFQAFSGTNLNKEKFEYFASEDKKLMFKDDDLGIGDVGRADYHCYCL